MTLCDLCVQIATRFAQQWFQFPRDPRRVAALCDRHWDRLMEQLDRLAGPAGRCPRCYTRLSDTTEQCGVCGLSCPTPALLQQAA